MTVADVAWLPDTPTRRISRSVRTNSRSALGSGGVSLNTTCRSAGRRMRQSNGAATASASGVGSGTRIVRTVRGESSSGEGVRRDSSPNAFITGDVCGGTRAAASIALFSAPGCGAQ